MLRRLEVQSNQRLVKLMLWLLRSRPGSISSLGRLPSAGMKAQAAEDRFKVFKPVTQNQVLREKAEAATRAVEEAKSAAAITGGSGGVSLVHPPALLTLIKQVTHVETRADI